MFYFCCSFEFLIKPQRISSRESGKADLAEHRTRTEQKKKWNRSRTEEEQKQNRSKTEPELSWN